MTTEVVHPHANAAAVPPLPIPTSTSGRVKYEIDRADFAHRGLVCEPFWMYVTPGTDFKNIWNSRRGTNPITFFQYQGNSPYFYALGDLVQFKSRAPEACPYYDDAVLLLGRTNLHPEAVAHPSGVEWILDDYRSGNPRDIKYWRLIPPAGYVSLGIAFTNGEQPDVNRYWCVKADLVKEVGKKFAWSDDEQHWTKHTGDVWVPTFDGQPTRADRGKMLVLPQTFLSFEDRGNETAYALSMPTMNLDLYTNTPEPFDTEVAGDRTASGVKVVKAVPFTSVTDAGVERRGLESPFYYISAEPYWYCTEVVDASGGTHTVTKTTGVTHEKAQAFRHLTSMTVSAEIGAAYEGGDAKLSASFTEEFELITASSDTTSTEVSVADSVTLGNGLNSIWERRTDIVVYRTNGDMLEPVTYRSPTMVRTKKHS